MGKWGRIMMSHLSSKSGPGWLIRLWFAIAVLPFSGEFWTWLICSWNTQPKVDWLAEWLTATWVKLSINFIQLFTLDLIKCISAVLNAIQVICVSPHEFANIAPVCVYMGDSPEMAWGVFPLPLLSQHSNVASYYKSNYYLHLPVAKIKPNTKIIKM